MTTAFEIAFGTGAAASARAPARANLLGEHTDYNEGYVLPTPLPFWTGVEVGPGLVADTVEAYSVHFQDRCQRAYGVAKQGDWLDYVAGCIAILRQRGYVVPALRVAVETNIPMGAGVSSSAALEVATLRAIRHFLDLPIDDTELALIGQAAESGYVGMPCGIMDQMVSSLGTLGQALFLDIRTRERRNVPLPAGHRIAVVHSGVSHQLVDGGYKQRVEECHAAAAALGVPWLRDVGPADLARINALPEPLNRRARHQMTENQRVLQAVTALEAHDVVRFGRLMCESHASQRDDYKVSVPAVDALVEAAMRHGALGARLTGGGFGGSIVALVADDAYARWEAAVRAECPACRPL
ncbi:MAG: galactokinase [Azospirillaceae bacterium]|nr:galactokinase [Azospirillaceae bacterium]